jgi:hypothetical protein
MPFSVSSSNKDTAIKLVVITAALGRISSTSAIPVHFELSFVELSG